MSIIIIICIYIYITHIIVIFLTCGSWSKYGGDWQGRNTVPPAVAVLLVDVMTKVGADWFNVPVELLKTVMIGGTKEGGETTLRRDAVVSNMLQAAIEWLPILKTADILFPNNKAF